jgi:hypothetical protein
MKPQDIKTGTYYYDGKLGIREVLAVSPVSGVVTYKVIAAKKEVKFNHSAGEMEKVVGTELTCMLASFAMWAKSAHTFEESHYLRDRLMAAKTKLSPGELDFMQSLLAEAPDAKAATAVSYNHTEGRAVTGLAKKGFLRKDRGEALLTHVGAIWLEMHLAAARKPALVA